MMHVLLFVLFRAFQPLAALTCTVETNFGEQCLVTVTWLPFGRSYQLCSVFTRANKNAACALPCFLSGYFVAGVL